MFYFVMLDIGRENTNVQMEMKNVTKVHVKRNVTKDNEKISIL